MIGVLSIVVHYWANLQSVYGFPCYDNIARTRNVSECLYSFYAWFYCSCCSALASITIHIWTEKQSIPVKMVHKQLTEKRITSVIATANNGFELAHKARPIHSADAASINALVKLSTWPRYVEQCICKYDTSLLALHARHVHCSIVLYSYCYCCMRSSIFTTKQDT